MSHFLFILEILASLLGIGYIVLIANKNSLGWLLGILSCGIFSLLCFYQQLNSQGIIQLVNVIMGIMGWITWNQGVKTIRRIPILFMLLVLLLPICYGLSFVFFNQAPWQEQLDRIALIYSFIATLLTIQFIYQNWYAWVVVNGITMITAFANEMYFFSVLSLVYLSLSFYGLIQWRK